MQTATRCYHLVGWFFGGAFLANAIPHLVNGVSGSPFQSPFASPPGQGLSSATVNVLWGMLNLALAYVLMARLGCIIPVLRAKNRGAEAFLRAGTGSVSLGHKLYLVIAGGLLTWFLKSGSLYVCVV